MCTMAHTPIFLYCLIGRRSLRTRPKRFRDSLRVVCDMARCVARFRQNASMNALDPGSFSCATGSGWRATLGG